MIKLEHKELLNAGVHFGHLTKKWNPSMAPFIFMKRNGIHIIDLNKTIECLQEAATQLNVIARSGKKIMFVATKKQAKDCVAKEAKELGMPYMTERWLGGTLTNFATIRKLLKKMSSIDKMTQSAAYKNLAKKEKLMITREQGKLNRILEGIANVTRLPAALFVIDVNREHIAVKEAKILGIPVFALADTNTDPDAVDYPIPSNDDALRSVEVIMRYISIAIKDGMEAYKKEKLESTPQVLDKGVATSEEVQKKASASEIEKKPSAGKKNSVVGEPKRERITASSVQKRAKTVNKKMPLKRVGDETVASNSETVASKNQTADNNTVTKESEEVVGKKEVTKKIKGAVKEKIPVSSKPATESSNPTSKKEVVPSKTSTVKGVNTVTDKKTITASKPTTTTPSKKVVKIAAVEKKDLPSETAAAKTKKTTVSKKTTDTNK